MRLGSLGGRLSRTGVRLGRRRGRSISQATTLKTKVAFDAYVARRPEHSDSKPSSRRRRVTNDDQPGVRLTKAAAARTAEPVSDALYQAAETLTHLPYLRARRRPRYLTEMA